MAQTDVILPTAPPREPPAIRSIGLRDLGQALRSGLDDFWAMPTHAVFLCLIYPIVGIALGWATFGLNVIPLLFPLAAGFTLIGPFAAIGLYELSRRREFGLDTSWRHAFDVVHSPSLPAIIALGLLLLVVFATWLVAAQAIYAANFPEGEPLTLAAFARELFTTPHGRNLILVGNAVGFLFAVLAFSLSVISFPLLLDRNVGTAVAIATSVKAIYRNPLTMIAWGLILAGGLVLGSLPIFIGLAIVMPVLGHASWHLYRKVVEPDLSLRPQFEPQVKGRRYGADFPVSLFVPSAPEQPSADDRRGEK
jgi:uncharacterized membrane protein